MKGSSFKLGMHPTVWFFIYKHSVLIFEKVYVIINRSKYKYSRNLCYWAFPPIAFKMTFIWKLFIFVDLFWWKSLQVREDRTDIQRGRENRHWKETLQTEPSRERCMHYMIELSGNKWSDILRLRLTN